MMKQNDPAHKGEAVDCFRAERNHGLTSQRLRVQFLRYRFGLSSARADLISSLAWEALA